MNVCACGHEKHVHVFGNSGCSACVYCDTFMPGCGPDRTPEPDRQVSGVPAPDSASVGDSGLCVLDHGTDLEGNPVNAETSVGRLCKQHRKRLDTIATDIHDLLFDLPHITEAGSAPKDSSPKGKHTKNPYPPAPANLDVIALLDTRGKSTARDYWVKQDNGQWKMEGSKITPVLNVIAYWVAAVAQMRDIDKTHLPSSAAGQLDWLRRHHDWIAAQSAVERYLHSIENVRKELRATLRDWQTDMTDRCPHCNGALFARGNRGAVECRYGCGAKWVTAQEQARLALMLEGTSA